MPNTTIASELFQVAAQTASSRQGPFDTQWSPDNNENEATLLIDIPTLAGTSPTVTIAVEVDVNGITYVVSESTALNAVGKYQLPIDLCPDEIYVRLTEGGTWTNVAVNCALVRG